jgi:glycosyltransferase involved in cell wall biosynthesis
MRNRSRVLAVIPAYNPEAENLAATLASLAAQTAPVDLCLIDDGSAPPIEAPDWPSGEAHLVRLPENGGITVALRAGVQFAADHGYEFICRLDVGDLSYPARVEKQLKFLDDHPGVDLVGAFARIVDPEGGTLFHHGIRGGPSAVRAYLWKNAPFRHSTFFARTGAIVARGSYDLAFDGAEDYELLLRLADRVDCLDETLIDYVVDLRGITETRRARQLRKRLKAQVAHGTLASPGWYAGVARTLIIMLMPRALASWATLRSWRSRER